jgi:hypothetical protein
MPEVERFLKLARRGQGARPVHDGGLGRQARLEPIGGHGGHAPIFGVIATPNGIDNNPLAGPTAGLGKPREQRRRADALVVIAHEHNVGGLGPLDHHPSQAVLEFPRDGLAGLVVHPDHLLRVLLLGPADVAFLHGGRAGHVGQDGPVVDAKAVEHGADADAVGVIAHHTGDGNPRTQCRQHHRHAAGAAKAFLATVGAKEHHRRLLADALGIAPDIPVEHEVAQDQNIGFAKPRDEVGQFRSRVAHVAPPALRPPCAPPWPKPPCMPPPREAGAAKSHGARSVPVRPTRACSSHS